MILASFTSITLSFRALMDSGSCRGPRELIPRAPIEEPAATRRPRAAPILEEERHPGGDALVADVLNPQQALGLWHPLPSSIGADALLPSFNQSAIRRPGRFAAGDDPVDAWISERGGECVAPEQPARTVKIQRPQQRLAGQEAHGGWRVQQHRNAHVGPVLG